MYDFDNSKEHVRAASKVGRGEDTNPIDAIDEVVGECNRIAQEQGGTNHESKVSEAVEKGRNDIDTVSDPRTNGNDPQGYRYFERIPRQS